MCPLIMRRSLLATAAGIAAFLAASAQAQSTGAATPATTTDEAKQNGIEEIVVTAQRRSENLQNVPISVTAFTAESLQARNIASTNDLMKVTPGLQFGSGSIQRNELTIRGIGSNRFDAGGESSSGVFIDDVYQPRFSNLLIDLLDVERVEVLKGPQGTLYGRNTIGGAIAIYTPTPGNELHINARAEAGTKNLYGGMVSVSGPLSDTLSASISGGYRSRDGFMKDITHDTDNGIESYGGRLKLLYKPTDRLHVTLTGAAFANNQNAVLFNRTTDNVFLLRPGIAAGPDTDRYSGAYSYPTGAQTRSRMASAKVDYEADAVALTSITAYQYGKGHTVDDQDSTSYDAFGYTLDERSHAFSQEFRISSAKDGGLSAGGRLKWVAGLFYFQEKVDEITQFRLGPDSLFYFLAQGAGVAVPGGAIFDTTGKFLTTRSYAAFGQATYAITGRLNVTLGARYTHDRKSFDATGTTNLPGFPLITSNFLVNAGKSWGKFTPKAAVDYKITDHVMAYASYARGYKSGAPQSAAFSPLVAARIVDPETVGTAEVGIKSELLDRHIRLNVAAYQSKFKNLQVRRIVDLGNGAATPAIDNAAGSTIKGVEVEAALIISSALRLDLGYNYLDAVYDNFISSGTDLSGNRLPRSPKHTLTASARYQIPLADGAKLSLGASVFYSSKFYFQPENLAPQDQSGYSTTDFNLTYAFPDQRLQASVWVKNAFDKEYRTYAEALAPSGRETWSDRRTAGITLAYRM